MFSSTLFTHLFRHSTSPEIDSFTDSLLVDSECHVAAIADAVVDALIERSRVSVSEDRQPIPEKIDGSQSFPEKIADAIIARLRNHDIDPGAYVALSQPGKGTSDSTSQVVSDVHHPCTPENETRPTPDDIFNERPPSHATFEKTDTVAESEDNQSGDIKHIPESHWILAPDFKVRLKAAVRQCHRVLFDCNRTGGLVEAYMATLESIKQSNSLALDLGDQMLAFAYEIVHDHYFKLLTVTLAKCDDALVVYTNGCKGKPRAAPDVQSVSIIDSQRLRVHPDLRAHAYEMCQTIVYATHSRQSGHGSGLGFWTGKERLATQEFDLIRMLKHAGEHNGVRSATVGDVTRQYQHVALECGDLNFVWAFVWLYQTYEGRSQLL